MHQISYIILAHENPQQIQRLIENLSCENVFFYIHVDLNKNIEKFEFLGNNQRTTMILDRAYCSWGDISLVNATLTCIRRAIYDRRTGHVVLLSGQDFPIRKKSELRQTFEKNPSIEFIDCRPIKEVWPNHYKYRTHAKKYDFSNKKGDFLSIPSIFSLRPKAIIRNTARLLDRSIKDRTTKHLAALKLLFFYKKKPQGITFYGGSQWWALTITTLRKMVLHLEKHPEILAYFDQAVIPDEVFFQTLIMHLAKFNPDIEITTSLTYTRWKSKKEDSPDTFQERDYKELMVASERFCFARKFNETTFPEIINLLEKKLTEI